MRASAVPAEMDWGKGKGLHGLQGLQGLGDLGSSEPPAAKGLNRRIWGSEGGLGRSTGGGAETPS